MNICDITGLTSEVHGDICMFVSLYLEIEEGGKVGIIHTFWEVISCTGLKPVAVKKKKK